MSEDSTVAYTFIVNTLHSKQIIYHLHTNKFYPHKVSILDIPQVINLKSATENVNSLSIQPFWLEKN